MTDRRPRSAAVEAADLVMGSRWGALATVDGDGGPSGSMVAYAPESGPASLLVFLSGLAAHTGHLLNSGKGVLVVGAGDTGRGDPQTLPRVSLECTAAAIGRDAPEFADAFGVYAARLPSARARLALPDFVLFRLGVVSARYVGGFARAATIDGAELARTRESGRQEPL